MAGYSDDVQAMLLDHLVKAQAEVDTAINRRDWLISECAEACTRERIAQALGLPAVTGPAWVAARLRRWRRAAGV